MFKSFQLPQINFDSHDTANGDYGDLKSVSSSRGSSPKTMSKKVTTTLPGLVFDFGKREQTTPLPQFFCFEKNKKKLGSEGMWRVGSDERRF